MADKREHIEIRQPKAVELDAVRQLRHKVLDEPIGVTKENVSCESDYAQNVIHMAAFSGSKVVSCVRFDSVGSHQYLIRRMATDLEYQGRGIGKMVLEAAEKEAKLRGTSLITLNSRPNSVGFYEKLGYTKTGKTKKYDNDVNFEMIKSVMEKKL